MSNVKHDRAQIVNQLVIDISSFGRRFFYSPKNMAGGTSTAHFFVDARGAIWFVDDYTEKPIYVAYRNRWQNFSHGGTLRALVQAMAEFIRSGQPIPAGHFGPWQHIGDDRDLWGYGKDAAAALQAKIADCPAIEKRAVAA